MKFADIRNLIQTEAKVTLLFERRRGRSAPRHAPGTSGPSRYMFRVGVDYFMERELFMLHAMGSRNADPCSGIGLIDGVSYWGSCFLILFAAGVFRRQILPSRPQGV